MSKLANLVESSKPHWRVKREEIFPEPAITRRHRIECKSPVLRSEAEAAYLEGCLLAEAFPRHVSAVIEGLLDEFRSRRRVPA